MKQRHLYVLLFSVPALVAALLAGFIVLAGAAGFMWLFVYGDDPWPRAAEGTLVVLFLFVSGTTWAVLLRRAWREGDQHEQAGVPPHVGRLAIAAAGITAVLLILVGLHQWNVGNIGPRTDRWRVRIFVPPVVSQAAACPRRMRARAPAPASTQQGVTRSPCPWRTLPPAGLKRVAAWCAAAGRPVPAPASAGRCCAWHKPLRWR